MCCLSINMVCFKIASSNSNKTFHWLSNCRAKSADPVSLPWNSLSRKFEVSENPTEPPSLSRPKARVSRKLPRATHVSCWARNFTSFKNVSSNGVLRPRHSAPTVTGKKPFNGSARTCGGNFLPGKASATPAPRPFAT